MIKFTYSYQLSSWDK
jgi:hypothetical protein